jgi:hypothetical protein
MSGLLLRSPCCVFCTVIRGCALISQAVHVQSQLTVGILSGYSVSALDRVSIVCTLTIRVNSSNLFQPLPWNLAQPVHPVNTEGESEAAVSGSQQASQSFLQTPPAAPQTGHLQIQKGLVRKRHIYSLVLSLMSTYTLSISCFA